MANKLELQDTRSSVCNGCVLDFVGVIIIALVVIVYFQYLENFMLKLEETPNRLARMFNIVSNTRCPG